MSAVIAVPRPAAARPALRLAGWARTVLRMAAATATVFLITSFGTYALGSLSESNPAAAVLGETATPADIVRMNHQFGLDRPLLVQYATWLGHAFTGDLGTSYFTSIPVAASIRQALPVDLGITGLAALFAVLIGGTAGIAAALNGGGRIDRSVTAACSVLGTIPGFVIGIVLIVLFSATLKVLPAGGYVSFTTDPVQWLRCLLMPSFALSLTLAAGIARQLRTSLVGTLRENYVVGATVRGLSHRRVLLRHALRNAVGPTLGLLTVGVPMLISGSVPTERIFNLPGVALLTLQSSERHDVPVIQGTLLMTVASVLVCNLVLGALLARFTPQARR
ncbi:ABC transporter permease [Actinomadura sp. DC4]|uniref:ABC transporter permease n=1 Tax=Actinomadura sp. DC4 TaxID=3055069 RepID=UPI0025AFC07F|nr:ABC transporter permease [Actinomadura sp. DC4]MDN3356385.1 ABC transporter permease [Actinomadura sp. DC4]